jgi:aminoglycoside phosphotransferase (APT) family kinase protein
LSHALDLERFAADLSAWAVARRGFSATVDRLRPMPGNAGLSFGFDLACPTYSVEPLVIRLAPPGVRRRGNTDVLRQVPLIDALDRAGIPVAPVLWSTDDPAWFGTDAFVQPLLDGLPLHRTDPAAGVRVPGGDLMPFLRQGIDVLARIHAIDWRSNLADWSEPRSVTDEIEFWRPILDKYAEPAWAEQGQALADRLERTDPGGHRVGLFHGDFQTHNLLYRDDGRLAAVIDWEIAGIGAVGLDLGWLMMMTDRSCWYAAKLEQFLVSADPADLVDWYVDATGWNQPHAAWYEALAAYRYGVIAILNLSLHRTGRRVDPVSELDGLGVPHLFARGLELIASSSGAPS